MEHVHVLADHGAWLLNAAGAAYGLLPSVHWLFASQAIALSFTAIPIWWAQPASGTLTKTLLARLCTLVAATGCVQHNPV
jgi:uncharacterized membrane protein